MRAKYIKIIPGDKVEAHGATLYVAGVPVFYFPYYSRKLGPRANNFNFVPGYRTSFGPFLLSSYNFFLNDQLDGAAHVDYRERRGVGRGAGFELSSRPLGRRDAAKYYYTHDQDPGADAGRPEHRRRTGSGLISPTWPTPATNLEVQAVVRYQSDTNIVREFFEGEYRQNPQPNTFFEVNRFWQNFSLDTYVAAAPEQLPGHDRAAARGAVDRPAAATVGLRRSTTRAKARRAIIGTCSGPPTAWPPGWITKPRGWTPTRSCSCRTPSSTGST